MVPVSVRTPTTKVGAQARERRSSDRHRCATAQRTGRTPSSEMFPISASTPVSEVGTQASERRPPAGTARRKRAEGKTPDSRMVPVSVRTPTTKGGAQARERRPPAGTSPERSGSGGIAWDPFGLLSGKELGPRSRTARRFAPGIGTPWRASGARRRVPIRSCLLVKGGMPQGMPPFHTFPPITRAANKVCCHEHSSLSDSPKLPETPHPSSILPPPCPAPNATPPAASSAPPS